jgi:Monogalactosyldiacylglycerol (MGDG) synthase/Glycosyltransferase family 28 C-terminal domain
VKEIVTGLEITPKVDFLFFDAGGGHRAAATALKSLIAEQGRAWDVRMVNLQEVLDSLDVFRKVTGLRLEDIYNQALAKGWTLGSGPGLKFMHGVIRLYHPPTVRLLQEYWIRTRPDIVVSLVPNFDRALYESLKAALPDVPFVTVLTDFADYPPHFWIERGQDQFLICGTEKAVEQARELGYTDRQILRTSGMILRPKFYEPVTADRAEERKRLGLDPERPTGLVLFGGQGSRVMLEIAERLPEVQLIFICGRNQKLAEKLRALPGKAPRYVEGFTSEIPYYMHLSDFFIGKPGPGSISEAVRMKLPVIVERNAWTLVQERYNVEWVREKKVGLVVENFRGIAEAVAELQRGLAGFKANVEKIENRAVFEIPEMLETILANYSAISRGAKAPRIP